MESSPYIRRRPPRRVEKAWRVVGLADILPPVEVTAKRHDRSGERLEDDAVIAAIIDQLLQSGRAAAA